MRKIDKLIIHCSATKQGKDIKMETIKSWHVKGRGWRDIGYHFIIELDGSIRNGRDVQLVGAHTLGENSNSIGICYIGGLGLDKKAKDTRTEAQKKSLIELITSLKSVYKEATVHGHNEFSSKSCPCFDVQKEFAKKTKKAQVKKANSDE